MHIISSSQAKELLSKKPSRSRYNAKPVKADGYTFASGAEHKRYVALKLLQRAGHIQELTVHPDYILSVNGVDLGKAVFDFEYMTATGRIIEDCKAPHTNTPISKWKRKHFEAQFGLKVTLV